MVTSTEDVALTMSAVQIDWDGIVDNMLVLKNRFYKWVYDSAVSQIMVYTAHCDMIHLI